MEHENVYKQVSDERYKIIMERNDKFRSEMDQDVTPINVFDPLPPKFVEELELIRDFSRYLQKKKDEDVSKAAQAAKQEDKEKDKETTEDKEVEKEDS